MIMLAKFFHTCTMITLFGYSLPAPVAAYSFKVREESVAQSPVADLRATPKSEPQISKEVLVYHFRSLPWTGNSLR